VIISECEEVCRDVGLECLIVSVQGLGAGVSRELPGKLGEPGGFLQF